MEQALSTGATCEGFLKEVAFELDFERYSVVFVNSSVYGLVTVSVLLRCVSAVPCSMLTMEGGGC